MKFSNLSRSMSLIITPEGQVKTVFGTDESDKEVEELNEEHKAHKKKMEVFKQLLTKPNIS